jgi:putative component of membrane protein insertase Oxa1/YidC/SpoIIIJ protein YidD
MFHPMRSIVILSVLLLTNVLFSQKNDLNAQLIETFMHCSSAQQTYPKRSLMFSKNTEKKRIGVVKAGFAELMYLYQNIFSEQISAACMYEISCSEYTKRQIEDKGLILGSIKGFHQLMHCTHGAIEEVPPFMKSNYSAKIKNSVD